MSFRLSLRLARWPCLITALMAAVGPVANRAQTPQAGPAGATGQWPQFRGSSGAGIADGDKVPPTEFSPSRNVLWTTDLPAGHSSPAIWGDRIFLTAFDKQRKTLEVIGLDRSTGKILWRRDVSAPQIETVHAVSSPATATPAVDGEQLYVYFGSFGVLAYDFDGNERWSVPMPLVTVPFGSGTSPIVVGDRVIVSRQEPKDPFIAALDRKTGKVLWKQPYEIVRMPIAFGSHSTPLVVRDQVVVHGAGRVLGFDLATGALKWWAAAATTGASSPVSDGTSVYVATWSPFGEPDQLPPLPSFDALVKHDANGDGALSQDEIPATLAVFSRPDTPDVPGATMPVRGSFNRFDGNKDGKVTQDEWDGSLGMIKTMKIEHGLLALKTDGTGDVSTTHLLWKEKTAIPEVPSPLVYRGRVYMVRNGGILTSLDASTGKLVYRARVGTPGPYYASPVVAGDRLFLASGEGIVSVVGAGGEQLNVISRNDLGEPIFATPAIANGVLYVRTASKLTAFGAK
jgi:outer membrane protein assembly factor BamB